ncbi:hypothetical protein [Conexibacter sp. SYSU D00693]|uniref:hypothetical protein n=1 Tax=Conexibacter sp. SYSU D00693 TaxID=2812560 RepID=UPI001F11DCAB|nr:hypothetical protein [Conexibacter sp. SYSU D00693]
MSLHRGIGDPHGMQPDPVQRLADSFEERKSTRTRTMATGTLACPSCDAPALPDRPLSPADPLTCGFCSHTAHVRDFLSLADPSRPARVVVRVAVEALPERHALRRAA